MADPRRIAEAGSEDKQMGDTTMTPPFLFW